MLRQRVIPAIFFVTAGVVALPAIIGLIRSGEGIAHSSIDLGGVPVTVLSTQPGSGDGNAKAPAVVVVHGFAASSVIMEPLGQALARAGYVVALPDVSGHGGNATPLDLDDTDRGQLQADVGAVVSWLADQPGVDARRITLVGHSMGAGAVTRYAVDHPTEIKATVAISLPAAIEPASAPRDLLLLYGSAEPSSFAEAALEQARFLQPAAQVGVEYGDAAAGSAVKVQEVPGVEHISIVWSPTTAQSTVDWLGAAVGGGQSDVDLDPAWLWLILLLVAGCLGVIPVTGLAYGPAAAAPEARVSGWVGLLITLGASVAASLIAALLGPIADAVIPLAVGGYLAVWFAAAALVIALSMLLVRRYRRRSYGSVELRSAVATLIVTSYVVVLLVVSARLTWATAAFVGPRWWVWIVASVAFTAYFYADAVLVSRPSLGGRLGVMVVNRLIVVAVLLLSVSFLGAPGILTLLLPFMVLLFVIVGYVALVVSTKTSRRWGPALVQGVPLAVVVATGFPLA